MSGEIIFDPLLTGPWLWVGLVMAGLAAVLAFGGRLIGAFWRGLAAVCIGLALLGPVLERAETEALPSIVVMVSDQTASAQLGVRAEQISAAGAAITAGLAGRSDLELRSLSLREDPNTGATALAPLLNEALADIPPGRLAGVVVLSDGQITDAASVSALDQPLHLLQAGRTAEWDQKLVVESVPAYGILDEPVTIVMRVVREGAVPSSLEGAPAELVLELDNGTKRQIQVPVDETVELRLTPRRAGANLLRLSIPADPDELTGANNATLVNVTGIRDRLRVLLVSGTPHAGERVWRNLLKSDSAVDLVHFTILRSLGKQDNVPVNELSLIAFPTQELFLDKIDEFDLIIFDRYRLQGILPPSYVGNIVSYVERGGAVLVAAGPEYASVDSLYRSSLSSILPASPTAQVIEGGYYPAISDAGARHPVTEPLMADQSWGPWYRRIGLFVDRGQVLMEDRGAPLMVLDRVEQGRVALIASDHIWLWARGHGGGGPHRDLLRRLAHWLMDEPDLDEEGLQAIPTAQGFRVERRSMSDSVGPLIVTDPAGNALDLTMETVGPGRFAVNVPVTEKGFYSFRQGTQNTVAGLGTAQPVELADVIGLGEGLAERVQASGGAVFALERGVPDLRLVREGRQSQGPGWAGVHNRRAEATLSLSRSDLLPGWLALAAVSFLLMAAWLREGRR